MKLIDLFDKNKKRNVPKNAFPYERDASNRFQIYEVSKQRITPAIDKYVDALEAASSKLLQMRVMLYDSYLTTLMVDSHVSSLLDKRLENVTNKTLVLVNENGEPIEDVGYFLSSPKFRQFTEDIILTKFWGFQLFEFDKIRYKDKDWFDYTVIPHKHINPYRKEVLQHQTDDSGVSFEDRDDCLFIGDPDDLGLLSKITLLSLYRRLGMFTYSKYLDLASENFTTLKVRGYSDDQNMDRIAKAIENRAGGGVLEIPDGMDLQMDNQSSPSQNQLFENYMKMIKEELAILILGQTMTTVDGSSRSQAEVHQEEQRSKYSSDEVYILDVLNYDFVDYLKLWFPNLSTNVEFKFVPNSDDEIADKLRNYERLRNLGVQFSDEELREKFEKII